MVTSAQRFQPRKVLRIFSWVPLAWLRRVQRLHRVKALRVLPVQQPRWWLQVRAHRQTCQGLRRAR